METALPVHCSDRFQNIASRCCQGHIFGILAVLFLTSFLMIFQWFFKNLNGFEWSWASGPPKIKKTFIFQWFFGIFINLSEQWTGSAVSMSLYVYVWHARSYLYKPVLESGLGLASPPRLGASPLATQMNLNKFKRSCLYRLVPGSGLGLASPPRFGGLRMN